MQGQIIKPFATTESIITVNRGLFWEAIFETPLNLLHVLFNHTVPAL